jgi:hypothetical protein
MTGRPAPDDVWICFDHLFMTHLDEADSTAGPEVESRRQTLARAQALYAQIAAEDQMLAEAYSPLIAESLPLYRVGERKR